MSRKVKKVVRNPDGTLRVVEIVTKTAKPTGQPPQRPQMANQNAQIGPKTVELGVAALRQLVENSVLQAKFPAIREAATQLAALGSGCWGCNRQVAAKRGPILNKVRKFLASLDEKDAQQVKSALGVVKFRVSYVDDAGNVHTIEK